MRNKKFTPHAVIRDTSEIKSRLLRRRFKFGSEIELSASPEALKERVTIEDIDGETVNGIKRKWTRVTIKGTYIEE